MADPPGPTIADDYVSALEPWMTVDLETYVREIGAMFEGVEKYTASEWEALFDVDACPVEALPWLAQLVGETLPGGLSEKLSRQRIRDRPNQLRGSLASVVSVAQRTLTGLKTVAVRERSGNVDTIAVRTLSAETPNGAAIATTLRRDTVPADIVLDYQVFSGAIYADIEAGYATYAAAAAANATYGHLAANLVGYTIYTA